MWSSNSFMLLTHSSCCVSVLADVYITVSWATRPRAAAAAAAWDSCGDCPGYSQDNRYVQCFVGDSLWEQPKGRSSMVKSETELIASRQKWHWTFDVVQIENEDSFFRYQHIPSFVLLLFSFSLLRAWTKISELRDTGENVLVRHGFQALGLRGNILEVTLVIVEGWVNGLCPVFAQQANSNSQPLHHR